MPTDRGDVRSAVSRRTALKSCVAGGVVALARCSTDGGNGDTGDNEHLQRLIWWYNQVLPMYGCVIAGDYGAINANDWHVDVPDELLANRVAEFNLTKIPGAELIPY